jgi:preprotein translocase subunit SecF
MRLFTLSKTYHFMRVAPICAVISALAMVATLTALFYPGPKLGTDFIGGTEIEVRFKSQVPAAKIREALEAGGLKDADVVEVRSGDVVDRYILRVPQVSTISAEIQHRAESVLCLPPSAAPDCTDAERASEVKFSPGGDRITTRFATPQTPEWIRQRLAQVNGLDLRPGADNPSVDTRHPDKVVVELLGMGDTMFSALANRLGKDVAPDAPLRIEWVGPKAGAQLRNAAIQSIAITLIAIMIYVGLRFDIRYSPGAVICLMYDALIGVGALMLAGKEISLTIVAAVLTIIGFSVNDTVVVYDRVRENTRRLRGASFPELIDLSVSEMLGRTVITTGTAMLSLTPFLIWGTNALQDFAFTMIIGMASGAYSTVFVALPITHWLDTLMLKSGRNPARQARAPRAKRELNPL